MMKASLAALVFLFGAACGRAPAAPPAPVPVSSPAPDPATAPTLAEELRSPGAHSGPLRRGPFVQAVGTAQAAVCFETWEEAEGKVEYEGQIVRTPRGRRHVANLKGLKPGTRFSYTVEPGHASGSFRTSPEGDGDLFFIAWGDSRTYYERLAKMALMASRDLPDFTVHSGDLVDEGTFEEDWDHFFQAAAPLLRTGAIWPALGNHEVGARQYFEIFSLPQPGNYYSFIAGPAQFFILDSNWGVRKDPRQLAWFSSELKKSTARFKFVICHYPLVSCPDDDFLFDKQSSMYGVYGPLIEEAKVTAVFQGHNHNYQRAERNGVLYITTGGAGAPLYPVGDLTPETKFAREINHYVRVRLSGRSLTLEAVDLSGQVFDHDERRVP